MKLPPQELLRKFCAAYYDEWVVAVLEGVGGPSLSAGICRSLEAMVGETDLADFLQKAVANGQIEVVADFKTEGWEAPAWRITDYM
jgi:hypothetical protein